MTREQAAICADLLLAHMSIDEDCGEGATAQLYAELMADRWPGKEEFTDDDVAGFVVEVMQIAPDLEPTP